jgi:hypothetical protein
MFADDTTLYKSDKDMDKLIAKFTSDLSALHKWCEFNRIDINWSKTFIMFVSNKRIKPPKEIMLNDGNRSHTVTVVSKFKLLGVTLDDKLKFDFTFELRNKIVAKMYTIKSLFQLFLLSQAAILQVIHVTILRLLFVTFNLLLAIGHPAHVQLLQLLHLHVVQVQKRSHE